MIFLALLLSFVLYVGFLVWAVRWAMSPVRRRAGRWLLAIAAVPLVVMAGRGGWRWWMDRELDRLCALDGGMKVYQTVYLPKEYFGPHGHPFPQARYIGGKRDLGGKYLEESETTTLVTGIVSLKRYEVRFTRIEDGALLGRYVEYKRYGGDPIPILIQSGRHCARPPGLKITSAVFKEER